MLHTTREALDRRREKVVRLTMEVATLQDKATSGGGKHAAALQEAKSALKQKQTLVEGRPGPPSFDSRRHGCMREAALHASLRQDSHRGAVHALQRRWPASRRRMRRCARRWRSSSATAAGSRC